MKNEQLLVIFILLYALVLGSVTINSEGMFDDQGNHAAAGLLVYDTVVRLLSNPLGGLADIKEHMIMHHAHYKSFASFMTYGPFHMVSIGAAYLLFGVTRQVAIFPTIFASMVTLYFTYMLSLKCYRNEKTALLTAFILAFSPLFFFYSTSAFMEVTCTMFLVITAYCFSSYMLEKKDAYLYLSAAAAALAILTKPPMALILPALMAAYFWQRGTILPSKKLKQVAVSVAIFAIILSPMAAEFAILQSNGISVMEKWFTHAGGFEKDSEPSFVLMDGTDRYYTGLYPHQNAVFYISTIFYTLYMIPFFLLALKRLPPKFSRLHIIEKICLVTAVIFFVTFSVIGGAVPRFMVYVLPFVMIPAARVIPLKMRLVKVPLVAIIMALAVMQCSQFLLGVNATKPTWEFDAASSYVLENSSGEVTVLSTNPRAQALSFALLDSEKRIYVMYATNQLSVMEQILNGTYSEPEWEDFGIKYPATQYVIIHENSADGVSYQFSELMSSINDFILVKIIDGKTPESETFIYMKQ